MIPNKPIKKAHDNELDETWLVGLRKPFNHPPVRRGLNCSKATMYNKEFNKRHKNDKS